MNTKLNPDASRTRAHAFRPNCTVCHGTGVVHAVAADRYTVIRRECECWRLQLGNEGIESARGDQPRSRECAPCNGKGVVGPHGRICKHCRGFGRVKL